MVLDPTGGPNHAGNLCDAPIIADPIAQTVYYQSSFYYIGHFSKFVRPGARLIGSRAQAAVLETAAFENPDGSIVAIVLNRADRGQEMTLKMGRKSARIKSPAHSILSLIGE